MFASATLLRPFRVKRDKKKTENSNGEQSQDAGSFEAQINVKEKLKKMLQNEKLIPRVSFLLLRMIFG